MNKIRSILKRASKIDMCYNTCLFIASSWGLDGDSLVFMRWSGGFLRDFLGRSFNMDDEFLVVYKYERFWRGFEPSIYAEIWCFSSYSLLMDLKTAFPWVPIPLPMDLKTAFPWVPIPLPMNLKTQTAFHESLFHCQWISRLHSHESLFQAYGSQDCIPWVPIPLPNFWSLLVGYHPCPAILLQTFP